MKSDKTRKGQKPPGNRKAAKWGKRYPGVVRWWEEKAEELLAFTEFPEEIRGMIYEANQVDRLFKELKRRLKVMEALQGEESAEKIVYAVLRLRAFEAAMERYNENKRNFALNVSVSEETRFA